LALLYAAMQDAAFPTLANPALACAVVCEVNTSPVQVESLPLVVTGAKTAP
jgi:hypothetical protein